MVALDFARKEFVQVVLQRRDVARQFLDARERDHAHFGVLEGDRLAAVAVVAHAVEAQEIAGHVVARDLLAAVVGQHRRLERTQPTAYSAVNGAPLRNSVSPFLSLSRLPSAASSWARSSSDNPTGRHNARMLHVAQCDRSVPIDTMIGVSGTLLLVTGLDMGQNWCGTPNASGCAHIGAVV